MKKTVPKTKSAVRPEWSAPPLRVGSTLIERGGRRFMVLSEYTNDGLVKGRPSEYTRESCRPKGAASRR